MLKAIQRILQRLRACVYDFFIGNITTNWYRQVLLECPMDAQMLDVGVGTASSLINNRDLLLSHRVHVTGVDYDESYVVAGRKHVLDQGLSASIALVQADIHAYNAEYKEKYDIIYFSGSFMIIPRQAEALKHCVKMLRSPVPKVPNGANIFFTQTFEKRTFLGVHVIPYTKKLLRLATSIDFGDVTFEDDFRKVLTEAGVEIVEMRVVSDRHFRSEIVVMARPHMKAE